MKGRLCPRPLPAPGGRRFDRARVNAVALHAGPSVSVTSDEGMTRINARQVVLATGVRKLPRRLMAAVPFIRTLPGARRARSISKACSLSVVR